MQMSASKEERPTPEAMQQLQHRLQAALQEISALKKQQTVDFNLKDCSSADTRPQGGSKNELSKDIAAMLRTLWLVSVFCIAITEVLMR